MGPSTWRESHNHSAGYGGTGPTDGRSPTTPQNEAGMRREPPRSVPSARAIIPVTRPAAPPPVEPPAVRRGGPRVRLRPEDAGEGGAPAPEFWPLGLARGNGAAAPRPCSPR